MPKHLVFIKKGIRPEGGHLSDFVR